MDIVEAVKRLKEARTTIQPYRYVDEAIDYIVKTLEQEPCDDAISRQAVLELVADYDLSMGQVVKGIHALPSVTPAEKPSKYVAPDVLNHWIGAEVLDKIQTELYANAEMHEDGDYYLREEWIGEIFDKYKPESGG